MRLVLNVIWVLFGGIWLWLLYLVAGLIACVTIIGIPFGLAAFRIGWYALWPFGRTVVDHPAAGVGSTVGNVLWLLVFGWWLALGHITTAIAQAITIVGIPLALILFLLYVLLLFLGWVTSALFLGRKGLELMHMRQPVTTARRIVALLAAVVALWLLGQVPVIGGWITFAALVLGIGALVWQGWPRRSGGALPTVAT